jgi:hypothetical protein
MTIGAGDVALRVDAALPLRSDIRVCAAKFRVAICTCVDPLRSRVGDPRRNRTDRGRCRGGLCCLLRLVAALADVAGAPGVVLGNLWCAPHPFLVTGQAFLPALQGVRNTRRPTGRCRRSFGWRRSRCRNRSFLGWRCWLVTNSAHLVSTTRMVRRYLRCASQTCLVTSQTGIAPLQRMRDSRRCLLGSHNTGRQQQQEDSGEYRNETFSS